MDDPTPADPRRASAGGPPDAVEAQAAGTGDAGDASRVPAERRARLDRIARLARVLDSQFRVPGTQRTFGVDALVGLIPGVGGGVGMVFSAGLILQAIHAGARPVTVVRMLWIAGADALIGSIPVVGTAADFVIKANQRNARILQSQGIDPDLTTAQSGRAVALTIAATLAVVGVVVILAVSLVVLLVRALT